MTGDLIMDVGFTVVPAFNGHFCIQESVPTWQVSTNRRDRHVGVEGSVLHIYGRHVQMTNVIN